MIEKNVRVFVCVYTCMLAGFYYCVILCTPWFYAWMWSDLVFFQCMCICVKVCGCKVCVFWFICYMCVLVYICWLWRDFTLFWVCFGVFLYVCVLTNSNLICIEYICCVQVHNMCVCIYVCGLLHVFVLCCFMYVMCVCLFVRIFQFDS